MKISQFLNIVLLCGFLFSWLFIGQSATSDRKYDPWLDVNDDGKINILDLTAIARLYSTEGMPMNKSEFIHDGCMNQPWWDSGWISCNRGMNTYYFNKTLSDPDAAIVYMYGKDSLYSPSHQSDYGGNGGGAIINWEYGANWQNLTSSRITVYRRDNDGLWNYVRIMIWQLFDP